MSEHLILADFGIFNSTSALRFKQQYASRLPNPQDLHHIRPRSIPALYSTPFFSRIRNLALSLSPSTMISGQNMKYDELRASEEALLATDESQVPSPLASCSQRRRITEGIFKALDRAHSKINCRLAVLQVLLITIYTVVFIILQSHTFAIDKRALIPCECCGRSRPPFGKADQTAL